MSYPDVYILRHGETEWNLVQRIQGSQDSPLTEKGKEQARVQAGLLEPILREHAGIPVYASPLGRARETARIAMGGCAPGLRLDLRLQEINAGAWEGLTRHEVAAGWPIEWALCGDDYELFTRAPNGETVQAAFDRAEAFLKDLLCPAVVITHGIFSCFLRGILMGKTVGEITDMPRQQGVIYHLSQGREEVIEKKCDEIEFSSK
jgi:probable phosphoglycerate mutase